MADEADVFRKLQRLSVDTVAQALRGLHDAGRGGAPRSARGAGDREGGRDVVFDVARLVLNVYEEFLRLQEGYHDVIADGLRDIGSYYGFTTGYGFTGGDVARERIPLAGNMGEVVRGKLRVDNEESDDVELTFRIGEFASEDERFTPAVTVAPPGCDVARAADRRPAAGERRVFDVSIRLEEPFRAWRRYVGSVFVVREGRTVGEVTIEVTIERAERLPKS